MKLFPFRKATPGQRRAFWVMYRINQRMTAQVARVIGFGGLVLLLLFERSHFFDPWFVPVVLAGLGGLGVWGVRHYK